MTEFMCLCCSSTILSSCSSSNSPASTSSASSSHSIHCPTRTTSTAPSTATSPSNPASSPPNSSAADSSGEWTSTRTSTNSKSSTSSRSSRSRSAARRRTPRFGVAGRARARRRRDEGSFYLFWVHFPSPPVYVVPLCIPQHTLPPHSHSLHSLFYRFRFSHPQFLYPPLASFFS